MSADMMGAHSPAARGHMPQDLDLRNVVQKMRGLDETQRLMAEMSGVGGSVAAPVMAPPSSPVLSQAGSAPLPQAGGVPVYTPGSTQPAFGHANRPAAKVPGW